MARDHEAGDLCFSESLGLTILVLQGDKILVLEDSWMPRATGKTEVYTVGVMHGPPELAGWVEFRLR